jgi:hypothetical protein
MNAQAALTKSAVVDQLTAQLAMRRRQTIAYHRVAQRVLGGTKQARRPQTLPVLIAARTRTAA